MDLDKAFETIFERNELNLAFKTLEERPEETKDALMKIWQQIVELIQAGAPLDRGRLNVVMNLFIKYKVQTAFPCLLQALSFKGERVLDPRGILMGQCLFHTLPDDESAKQFLTHILNRDEEYSSRFAALTAARLFAGKNFQTRSEQLEELYSKIIDNLETCSLNDDPLDNHWLLKEVVENCIEQKLTKLLYGRIRSLLIRLIVCSKSGHRFNDFDWYYRMLAVIDPEERYRVTVARKYIQSLYACLDNEIFEAQSLEAAGKYLIEKTMRAVEGANEDTVKMAVKGLQAYPYNNRPIPGSVEEYYREICGYLEFKSLPANEYCLTKKMYCKVFKDKYEAVMGLITGLIGSVQKMRLESNTRRQQIITDSKVRKFDVTKPISDEKDKLLLEHFRAKELDALWKKYNDVESGLLIHFRRELECLRASFCQDDSYEDLDLDLALKRCALRAARSWSDFDSVQQQFSPYKSALHQLEDLLSGAEPLTLLRTMGRRVRFFSFHNMIMESCPSGPVHTGRYKRIKSELEAHPLNPKNLVRVEATQYLQTLVDYLPDAIANIRKMLENSVCLNKRKDILEHALKQIEDGKYEVAVNLLPIQIEGLFADLLEFSTIYDSLWDSGKYITIFNQELVRKIQTAIEDKLKLGFDYVAYYKYYFNSIIRNTIAHGNYRLLAAEQMTDGAGLNGAQTMQILALEMLLDLNSLASRFVLINEADQAKQFIAQTAQMLKDGETAEERYSLILWNISWGKRDPLQILCWIFNPAYEPYLNAAELAAVRKAVQSCPFWRYVLGRSNQYMSRREREGLQKVVGQMFKVHCNEKVKNLLMQINKKLHTEGM